MHVFEEKQVKARKPHRCSSCDRLVEAGETYTRWSGISPDFGHCSAAFHTDCRELECKLNRVSHYDNEDDWMSLRQHVEEGGIEVLDGAPESVRARFLS